TMPTVNWQTPSDGATILSAPGNLLQVAVDGQAGTAFDGTVTFTSDIDGDLCNNIAPSDGTANCVTNNALSIGAHTPTAFATNASGGAQSAAITVNVADTPPSVTITTPANNAVLAENASITFTATVTDPDQGSFT